MAQLKFRSWRWRSSETFGYNNPYSDIGRYDFDAHNEMYCSTDYPVKLYPTVDDMPVRREEIPIWPHEPTE